MESVQVISSVLTQTEALHSRVWSLWHWCGLAYLYSLVFHNSFLVWFCECVCSCLCVREDVCRCVSVCVSVGQRSASGIFLLSAQTFFLKQSLPLTWRWPVQKAQLSRELRKLSFSLSPNRVIGGFCHAQFTVKESRI